MFALLAARTARSCGMTGVRQAPDAMLDAYYLVRDYADSKTYNVPQRFGECKTADDVTTLIIGIIGIAEFLRGKVAEETGESLEVLDERLIASLLIEGAVS